MALYPKRIVNSIVKRALRDKQSNNITEESTTDTVKIFTDLKFSDNIADRTVKNCIKKLYKCFFFFFSTATWLSHGQLWAIIEGIASLTRC